MDNTLAYIDQASFLGLRALGRGPLGQFIWIYDGPVDIDGLRRFQRNLGTGMLGRLIERSPLPFGRHRWVRAPAVGDIGVAAGSRDRADVSAWAQDCAGAVIDPERGPGWHLAVQPLTDGGTAVSLVVSHSVADGLGMLGAITDAVNGRVSEVRYPDPGSRARGAALRRDTAELIRTTPAMARALSAPARPARRDPAAAPAAPPKAPRRGRAVVADVPAAAAFVDIEDWDLCAKNLGGTSNSLFAAIAARLGAAQGRLDPAGLVQLSFPVDERVPGDTRANALTSVLVPVDPGPVTVDLTPVRGALRHALTQRGQTANELLAPLPLTPLTPRRLARRLEGMALGSGLPVGCSNLGDIDAAVNRPDGTDATFFLARLIEPGLTVGELARMGGRLHLASGRIGGRVFLAAQAYRPGAPNTVAALRAQLDQTLSEFGLTAASVIDRR